MNNETTQPQAVDVSGEKELAVKASGSEGEGSGSVGQVGGKNYVYCYQTAIEVITRIRETQNRENSINISRDLYPFRAIVDACINPSITTEETIKRIDKAFYEHSSYGNLAASPAPGSENSANRPKGGTTRCPLTKKPSPIP